MPAFLVSILTNLLVGAVLAFLSALLIPKKSIKPPEPSDNDYSPTAKEGTEIKHLFGAGPVELLVVAVFDRETKAIRR